MSKVEVLKQLKEFFVINQEMKKMNKIKLIELLDIVKGANNAK